MSSGPVFPIAPMAGCPPVKSPKSRAVGGCSHSYHHGLTLYCVPVDLSDISSFLVRVFGLRGEVETVVSE
jgi:hypothetical protein